MSSILWEQPVQKEDLEVLMELSCLASRSLKLDETIPDALASVAALVPADRIVLLSADADDPDVLGHWVRSDSNTAVEWCRLQGSRTVNAAREPRHCLYHSSSQWTEVLPYLKSEHARVEALIVPLVADHGILGRLDIIRAGQGSFSAKEQGFACRCAKILALSLRNAVEYARVAWLAEHDPLTGIGNRRRFDASLLRELTRAERYGRNLSLVLIDLDDFKQVNSHLGLSGGDEILRRTAQALASGARHGVDVACRIGGDEFALILPEIDERAANDFAQRLLHEVTRCTVPLWPMKFSYSISTYPNISGDLLRGSADSRLLDAKHRKEQEAPARVQ